MEYRKLGSNGPDVSKICLGTMTWGEQNTQPEAFDQMDLALEHGVNFFDTAELYPVPPKGDTQGATETIIGNWFAKSGKRDQIVLATKVAGPAPMVEHIRGGAQLNQSHIEQAIHSSLQRLQTDVIDLYQVHWPARPTNFFGKLGYGQSGVAFAETDHQAVEDNILEILQCMDRLMRDGKIRHWGLSNETPWGLHKYLMLAERHNLPKPVSVQNPYNLLNRSYEVGMSEFAHRENIGLLAYSPLAFGVLSGKYLHGQRPAGARLTKWDRFSRYTGEIADAAVSRYVVLASQHNLDPAQMALAWVNQQPQLTSNIIGATSIEQLESNLQSAQLVLSDELLEQIETIHEQFCNPCP